MPPTDEPRTATAVERAAHEAFQAERRRQVTGPTGPLALVGYEPVPAAGAAQAVRIALLGVQAWRDPQDAGVRLRAVAEGVSIDDVPFLAGDGERLLAPLGPQGGPLLRRARMRADAFSLDGTDWELRLYDAQAPALARFDAIETWPYDPAWRVTAYFQPFAAVDAVPWGFTREADTGHRKQVPGTLRLVLDGATYEMTAFLEGTALVLVFGDATSGRESYAPGRFLKLPAVAGAGPVELDFNRAIVPPCGFSDHFSCPVPPASNKLPMPVRAGEARVRWRDAGPAA